MKQSDTDISINSFNLISPVQLSYHIISYGVQHPQALVAAIRAGELPLSDSRPFCNQLAWLMSGEDIDYTRIDDDQEASRYFTVQ